MQMKIENYISIRLFLFFSIALLNFAESLGTERESALPDSVFNLDNIEVTAKRRPLATMQTLDGTQLQSLSTT